MKTGESDNVFLVVCEDRHTDPEISIHRSRDSADARIEEFKTGYGDRYRWTEKDYGRSSGWLRCVESSHDDGPSARIESKKIIDPSSPSPGDAQ